MKFSRLSRCALGACAALAIFAGCNGNGGDGSQIIPVGPAQQMIARPAWNGVRPTSVVYTRTKKKIYPAGHLSIDLNNDGIKDFTLDQTYAQIYEQLRLCGWWGSLVITPAQNGNAVAEGAHFGWAAAMRAGDRIDAKLTFDAGNSLMGSVFLDQCLNKHYSEGYWLSTDSYLGLKFQIHGRSHYGWAQLSVVTTRGGLSTILTGYAYQTVAGKPILAGQTR